MRWPSFAIRKTTLVLFLVLLSLHCSTPAPVEKSMLALHTLPSGPSPAGVDSAQPNLSLGQDGTVYLSWQEGANETTSLRFASWTGKGWSAPRTISSGSNWFVNWADFPSLIALPDGSLAAHWLVRSGPGTYAYDVHISRSVDAGAHWSQPITPHRDGTQNEHGFVSLIPWTDSSLGAVWLDGREMADRSPHEEGSGPMTLRFATIDSDGNITSEELLDNRVCDCCQTSAARTPTGAIVVYRDRSDEEIRDISSVVFRRESWSRPRKIADDGWQIEGCPVNGPSISVLGDRVAVAWFTMAGGEGQVKIAFSEDGGLTFAQPIDVSGGDTLGRVDIALLQDGSALVSRLELVGEEFRILLGRVQPDHSVIFDAAVASSSGARSSGFPQIVRSGEEIFLAWTDGSAPSQVLTSRLAISE